MSETHACPYVGCPAQLTRAMLACRKHWALVSSGTRSGVYAHWRHGDPTLEYFEVREDAVNEMNMHNPAAHVVVEPAPLVLVVDKPQQYLCVNTPTGRVNIDWPDGEWPPPERISYDGRVYNRTRFSQLDAETVTGSHLARGGEYDLIVLPGYQPNLDDPGTYPTLEG